MELKFINIGIAELYVSYSPAILRTILGSCVGVCLYDYEKKVGGMSHIMLPVLRSNSKLPRKYADSAIPMLVEELEKMGADKIRLTAKIIGGSKMFNINDQSVMGKIGNNNVEKVKEVLKDLDIKIIAEDVRGKFGRTVDFYLETGEVKIKSVGKEEKTI